MTKTQTTTPDQTARTAARDRLLLAVLPHVAFDGWTGSALAAGATDAGVPPVEIERLFPGGVAELIAHLGDWIDRQMAAGLATRDLAELRLRERVALAVRLRLEALGPHREALRRTLSWLALPQNVPLAAGRLYRAVDAVWCAVGDRSVDFSFYTKRALLAGVVSATTLYWLQDESEDCAATWGFLDRRIADVMRIPALKGRVERFAHRLPDPLRPLRGLRELRRAR
jgi:ubiquinone biosynthesis protein COQ9